MTPQNAGAGDIVWEWICSECFDEFDFDQQALNTLYRNPNLHAEVKDGIADWMHINSLSVLGPNKWHANGDTRFHPENLIWSSRQTNIIAIIDKNQVKSPGRSDRITAKQKHCAN